MAFNIVTARGKAFRFDGVAEIKQNLTKLLSSQPDRRKDLKKVYISAAMWLRNEARSLAPVGTKPKKFHLKDAIFAAYGDPFKQSVLVGVNSRMAPHGHMVEYGTSHAPPHPYLRPAIAVTRPIVVRVIKEGFLGMLEDALR